MHFKLILTTVLSASALFASAQADLKPDFVIPSNPSGIIIHKISDNGQWGLCEIANQDYGSIEPLGGYIVNLNTMDELDISDDSGFSSVQDISNDGNIVVGSANTVPAYWSRQSGKWTKLPVPQGYVSGVVKSITPDGRYAVGYVNPVQDIYKEYPVMYDLSTGSLMDIPGIPTKDMQNMDQKQNRFEYISADGRYVLGTLSISYMLPISVCSYVYDVQTHTYTMLGFDENFDAPANQYGRWNSWAENMLFIQFPSMSCSGEWITGQSYMAVPIDGSEYCDEYYSSFRYNVLTKEFELYPESDFSGVTVSNSGTVFAATPAESTYCYSYVHAGKYNVSFDQIFKQVYGVDLKELTGFENSGKVVSVSEDGMTLVMMTSSDENYILRLKEPITEAAKRVDLLAEYVANPATGSILSSCGTFKLRFDRNVDVNKTKIRGITFAADDGSVSYTPMTTGGLTAEGSTVSVIFRSRDLEKDKNYTLTIPAGTIYIDGDKEYTNKEIVLHYVGRDKTPVTVVEAYPADGASVSTIDMSNNPLLLTFDAQLNMPTKKVGYMYRADDVEPTCELSLIVSGNQIMAYPLASQRLFKGIDYTVVIPENVVTDICGNGANEEIRLTYHGVYERQDDSQSDRILFSSDCSNYEGLLFYEGDHLNPASVPASWNFTQDNTPWYIVRSSEATSDMSLASHSMYSPAGKSDDWMVIQQTYLNDANCTLQFDAQSYLNSKTDRLKIYVYADADGYNSLTEDVVNKIRTEGVVVFDEVLSPGSSEEELEGDWQTYSVSLADFANKDVYIAFVNENENQSAVFVDNINVLRDLTYSISFDNNDRVINKENINISGSVQVVSETAQYNNISLELFDSQENLVDKIEDSNINLSKDNSYKFEFSNALPLEIGVVNSYSVKVTLDDNSSVIRGTIKNLSFAANKKVVIEEYTGRDCGNCPMGYLAFDYLAERYGDAVIPVGIHTYGSDPYGLGMAPYSQYLGLDAVGAPSARINRNPKISGPMIETSNGYSFSGGDDAQEQTWFDLVKAELEQPADLGIKFTSQVNDNAIDVNLDVRSAINSTDNAINVFAVLLENDLSLGYQVNYCSSYEAPIFGEWGKGGQYGTTTVRPFYVDDVARAVWGTTFNGTGGLVPATLDSRKVYSSTFSMPLPEAIANIDNCDVVVMLINSGTGEVINCNKGKLGETVGDLGDLSSIGAITADSNEIVMSVSSEKVNVNAEGMTRVQIYNLAGMLIGYAQGNDNVEIAMNGYNGLAIINVVTENGQSVSKKVYIR